MSLYSKLILSKTQFKRLSPTKKKTKRDLRRINVRIPKLDNEINEVFDQSKDKKYLEGENMDKMFEII
jgi:hypothetical protein